MKLIERGVMVLKGERAWGVLYADGRETVYGWMNPAHKGAGIHDPKYVKLPHHITYPGSPSIKELQKGRVASVTRTTIVKIT